MKHFLKYLILILIIYSDSIFTQSLYLDQIFSINEYQDTLLYQIQGFTTTSKNEIIVSDKIDYKIKKINHDGSLIKSAGRRGGGPGEFNVGPANIVFSDKNSSIAVVDHTQAIVKIFNSDLKFIFNIYTNIAIADLDYDNNGNLIIATIPLNKKQEAVTLYNSVGEKIFSFNPSNLIGNPLYDLFFIEYNHLKNLIILMYRFRNLIQIYNTNGKLIQEFSIKGLPEIADSETTNTQIGKIPVKDIFWDIASDKFGNLYIIGGDYSPQSKMTIYLTDYKGNLLNIFLIKEKSSFIHVDQDGFIWTSNADNTIICKNKLP